jgi:hypothetical protein
LMSAKFLSSCSSGSFEAGSLNMDHPALRDCAVVPPPTREVEISRV